jgi:hypothetical protein
MGDGSLLVQLTTAPTSPEEYDTFPPVTTSATTSSKPTARAEVKLKNLMQMKKQRTHKNSTAADLTNSNSTTLAAPLLTNTTEIAAQEAVVLVAGETNYERSNNIDEYDLANYVFTITTSVPEGKSSATVTTVTSSETNATSKISSQSSTTLTSSSSTTTAATTTEEQPSEQATQETQSVTNPTMKTSASLFSIQGFTRTATRLGAITKTEPMLIDINESLFSRLSNLDMMSKRNLTKEQMIVELDSIRKMLDTKIADEQQQSKSTTTQNMATPATASTTQLTTTKATSGTTLSIELNAAAVIVLNNGTKFFNISSMSTDYIEGVEFVGDEETEEGGNGSTNNGDDNEDEAAYEEENVEVKNEEANNTSQNSVESAQRLDSQEAKVERMSSLVDNNDNNNSKNKSNTLVAKSLNETITSRMETTTTTATAHANTNNSKSRTNLLALDRPFKAVEQRNNNSSSYNFHMSFSSPKVESFRNEAAGTTYRVPCTKRLVFLILSCNFYLIVL